MSALQPSFDHALFATLAFRLLFSVMLWLLESNAAVGVYTDVVCIPQELDTARATVQARAEVVVANNEDPTVDTSSLLTRLVTV